MRLVKRRLEGDDHGFCVGTVAVRCSRAESEALSRLPDVYHPILDVFEARTVIGVLRGGEGEIVQLRVQIARADAASLELLLRQRVHELIAWRVRDAGRVGAVWRRHAGV